MTQNKAASQSDVTETNVLELFHEAASRVPAYSDFLKTHKVEPQKITSMEDFYALPAVTKDDYLYKYPLEQLQWDGNLHSSYIISTSSGSTGEPFIWGRNYEIEDNSYTYYQLTVLDQFKARDQDTLFIVSFSLGAWAAGTATMLAGVRMRKEGAKVTVATPGANKEELINCLKNLSPYYEQTIICGYPPFVKEAIDHAAHRGLELPKLNLKFWFGGEAITENWRDYLLKQVGQDNPLTATTNVYACSEALVMGVETPLSIAINKVIYNSPELINTLFQVERAPTLVQHDPSAHFFEEDGGDLLYTVNSAIPLIRYKSGDRGGIYSYQSLMDEVGGQAKELLKQYEIQNSDLKELPFIYIFGRDFNNVTFYSLNIYPENIQAGLLDEQVCEQVSSKFIASTEYTDKQDQYLLVCVELAPGVEPNESLRDEITDSLVRHLKELNSEYRELTGMINERSVPTVQLYANGDPLFQQKGNKLRLTKDKS